MEEGSMSRKFYFLAAIGVISFLIPASVAFAGAGECSGGVCGTPQQSGGGCGCCGGGSILINNTDEGDTYQYADDYDEDGIEDDFDNCPFVKNKSQVDADGDGVGDSCDICPAVGDVEQLDVDGDGIGNACDDDMDNDGLLNAQDNCALVSNNFDGLQPDADKDGLGDACDEDDDNDGILDAEDNCALIYNPLQQNSDINSFGDACDNDQDKDNIKDSADNCPMVANFDQKDFDGDKIGDACDLDLDNDGIINIKDNCLENSNADQADADRDGKGDACDSRFCYVVYGDEKNCLDPKTTFQVYGPLTKVKTGEETRLRLFANRENVPIRYKWIVEGRPAGSNATVVNAQGTVRVSSPYEYHYVKSNVATFTADEPGEYKIKLTANLVFQDEVNANFPKDSMYIMTVVAEGDSTGGCSMARGTGAGAIGFIVAGLLLGLSLLFRRRK